MQIIEHLRQLFLYDWSQKGTEKEKNLKMRQKKSTTKRGSWKSLFLRGYFIVENYAKRHLTGTNQAPFSPFSLCYRAFLYLVQRQGGKIESLHSSFHVSKNDGSRSLPWVRQILPLPEWICSYEEAFLLRSLALRVPWDGIRWVFDWRSPFCTRF